MKTILILNEWYFDKILKPNIVNFYSFGWWKTSYKNNSIFS